MWFALTRSEMKNKHIVSIGRPNDLSEVEVIRTDSDCFRNNVKNSVWSD